MMDKSYRTRSILLYIGTLLSIILTAISLWNINLKYNKSLIFLSLLLLLFAVILVSWLYLTYLKSSDKNLLENIIRQKVEEERTKIFSEFSKETEKDQELESAVETEKKIDQILPKGSFKNLDSYAKRLLSNLADEFEVTQGIFYAAKQDFSSFGYLTGYALTNTKNIHDFNLGENLNGQTAASQEIMVVKDIPDDYLSVESGLGKSKPRNLVIIPFINQDKTFAVLELTTFQNITSSTLRILNDIAGKASEKMVQLNMA